MKKFKIAYWVTTVIFFVFDGVLPALTGMSDLALQALKQLGYPPYFALMLVVFKVAGGFALILPQVPARLKEWAYAGFTFTLIAAFVSNWATYGPNPTLVMAVVFQIVLMISYFSYHKIKEG